MKKSATVIRVLLCPIPPLLIGLVWACPRSVRGYIRSMSAQYAHLTDLVYTLPTPFTSLTLRQCRTRRLLTRSPRKRKSWYVIQAQLPPSRPLRLRILPEVFKRPRGIRQHSTREIHQGNEPSSPGFAQDDRARASSQSRACVCFSRLVWPSLTVDIVPGCVRRSGRVRERLDSCDRGGCL
jgi:hypothetical protein